MLQQPRRRRRGALGTVLITLIALIAAACVALAVFVLTFNVNTYRPEIEDVASRAIGRQLTLAGPIRLKFALHPTIELSDVALANPPGFSRPQMASAHAIDVQVALLPLLRRRLEIDRVIVLHPDVLLERAADGTENWRLIAPESAALPAPAPQKAPPPEVSAAPPAPAMRPKVMAIGKVEVQGGTLEWRDDRSGHAAKLVIDRLEASGGAGAAPMQVSADASFRGAPLNLEAVSGPLSQFAENASWPVKAILRSAGATLTADGGRDANGNGKWHFALNAAVPDLSVLRPFLPQVALPPLRDVTLTAQLSAAPGAAPNITDVLAHAGASDLAMIYPGLRLTRLETKAPAMNQPVHAGADLTLNGVPVAVSGQLGAPDVLRDSSQTHSPYPIDVTAQAAGTNLIVHGGIASTNPVGGLSATIEAKSADLASLSRLMGRPLPSLHDVSFVAHATDSGGLTHGVSLSDVRLTAPQGNLAGSVVAIFTTPPNLHAALSSDRLDLDALRAVLVPPPPAPSTVPQPAGTAPSGKSTQPHLTAKPSRLIPDTPLPFAELRTVNGDVNLTVAALKLGNENWRNVVTHLIVQGGRLALPFSAQLPGGPLNLSASADATRPVPTAAISLRAPALALQWLLAAAGQPGFARGSVAAMSDLHAAGATTQALLASLDGTLTLSMTGGEIETSVLQRALNPVIARANLLGALGKSGASEIRCLAIRAVSSNGHVRLSPLLMSSALLTLSGSGNLDLPQETLDLQLSPMGRVAGTTVAIPMRLTGSWLAPRVSVDDTRAAASGLAAVVGAISGKAVPGLYEPAAPSCANALAGQPVAQPQASATTGTVKPPPPPNPAELLRKLLR